jgi:hypothetical protein
MTMKMRVAMLAALLIAAPAGAVETKPAATALPDVLTGKDIKLFADVLQAEGYRAKIETASDGSTYIASAANGTNISINFEDCKLATGCGYLRITAWWEKPKGADPESMNRWNNGWKLLRATFDDDKDVIVDYYYPLAGGVMRANFMDVFEWYASVASDFSDYLDKLANPSEETTSKK